MIVALHGVGRLGISRLAEDGHGIIEGVVKGWIGQGHIFAEENDFRGPGPSGVNDVIPWRLDHVHHERRDVL
ncbi:hypothetical protein LCGC14_2700500, partial [marine sediment metagenome]